MKETEKNSVPYVTCLVRGKPIKLTPEEAVRQLYVMVLTDDLGYMVAGMSENISKLLVTRPQATGVVDAADILADLRELIQSARHHVATVANAEQVELLQLDEKSIRVAEYLTGLPPIELLRSRLHLAIELAREQSARRES